MITLFGLIAGCLYLGIAVVYAFRGEWWLMGAWLGWGLANISYGLHEWFK